MRTVIIANGSLNHAPALLAGDIIIAADGGGRHCLALGLNPTVVIGDLDSLTDPELQALRGLGAEVIQFPPRKDFTDLELALDYARSLTKQNRVGEREILIIGALGKRWDQTLANLALPAAFPELDIRLVDGNQEILYVRGGETVVIRGRPGDTLSLIPLGGEARGVTTNQLEYPLADENLSWGSTRGISNVLLAEEAQVSLRAGLLVCVVIHQPETRLAVN